MVSHKDFALSLAEKAGKIMRDNFITGTKIQWKEDETPLTLTDKTINKMVVDAITKEYPDHGILAEEGGSDLKESEFVWLCDPLDGTVPFSHGYPTFVFSLSLVKDGNPVLGVIYDPIVDRLLFAEKGRGATMNGKPIHVSKADKLSRHTMVDMNVDHTEALRPLLKQTRAWVTSFYSFQYGSMLVALGEFTADMIRGKSPWDGASPKIIVEEAGGRVTDLYGNEQRYDRELNGVVTSNSLVHDEVLSIIKRASVESPLI